MNRWLAALLLLSSGCIDQPEEQSLPTSCEAIRAEERAGDADGPPPSGTYGLVVENTDEGTVSRSVWCNMEEDHDGGGWILVGRSAESGEASSFGWTSATGFVTDYSEPYSLDVIGLSFSEILFGAQSTEPNELDLDAAYKVVDVPADFLTAFASEAWDVTTLVPLGSCDPSSSPTSMLTHLGYTEETRWFFIRDAETNENFGLMPNDGFRLADPMGGESPCERAGDLNWRQGLIFVR